MRPAIMKAVLYHDYKAVRMLLVSFIVIFCMTFFLHGFSTISKDLITDTIILLFAFFCLSLGSGLRARDERLGNKYWIDALPVKFSSIIVTRFIFRLLIVLLFSPLISYFFNKIVKLDIPKTSFLLMLAIMAYCSAAVFGIKARRELQGIGIGFLVLIIFLALLMSAGIYSPVLDLNNAPLLLLTIFLLIFIVISILIIYSLGKHACITSTDYVKRASLAVLAFIVITAVSFGMMMSYAHNQSIRDMYGLEFGTVLGDTEHAVIYAQPLFAREKDRIAYRWIISPDEAKISGIMNYYERRSDLFSPNGSYNFKNGRGIYTVEDKKTVASSAIFGKWSPDSLHLAATENCHIRFINVEVPSKQLLWKPLDTENRELQFASVLGWMKENTVIVAEYSINASGVRRYYLWEVMTDLESRVFYDNIRTGIPFFGTDRYFLNPANNSIVKLFEEDGAESHSVIKEIFIESGETIIHAKIKDEYSYAFFADSDKALIAYINGDMTGEKSISIMDILTGEINLISMPGIKQANFPKFSLDGKYLAYTNNGMLNITGLENGTAYVFPGKNVILYEWTENNNMYVQTESMENGEIHQRVYYYRPLTGIKELCISLGGRDSDYLLRRNGNEY